MHRAVFLLIAVRPSGLPAAQPPSTESLTRPNGSAPQCRPSKWSRRGAQIPFTATLYVMNSGYYLYMGITINDDEFTTSGTWLPKGDGFSH